MADCKKSFLRNNIGAIVALLGAVAVVLVDRVSKYFAVHYLQSEGNSVPAVKGLLNFTLSYNDGMAFGLGSEAFRWVFVAVMIIVGAFFVYLMFIKNYNSRLFLCSAALIIGGGVGNMIDRVVNGYVVDFLALTFFPPICNIADYAITVGTLLLLIYVIFVYGKKDGKKEELQESITFEKDDE